MAWCHQATSHYMSWCWPSSMMPYGITRTCLFNSLSLGIYKWNFEYSWAIFKVNLMIDGCGISWEIAFKWMLLALANDKSIIGWRNGLVPSENNYLSQCWPSSVSPYGITRPQRVKHYFCHCWCGRKRWMSGVQRTALFNSAWSYERLIYHWAFLINSIFYLTWAGLC